MTTHKPPLPPLKHVLFVLCIAAYPTMIAMLSCCAATVPPGPTRKLTGEQGEWLQPQSKLVGRGTKKASTVSLGVRYLAN